MISYEEQLMAKLNRYMDDNESNQQEVRGKRYVDLNKSVFKLQYDEDFLALAYSTARIW